MLAELIFGGRTGLRAISDRNAAYRGFASAVGLRMIAAGLAACVHALLPPPFIDGKSRISLGLRTLFEGRVRTNLSSLDDAEQERTLIVVLVAAIWAAILPWLAGAEALPAGLFSVLALAFPLLFLATAPAGRIGKSVSSLLESKRS